VFLLFHVCLTKTQNTGAVLRTNIPAKSQIILDYEGMLNTFFLGIATYNVVFFKPTPWLGSVTLRGKRKEDPLTRF